MNHELLDILEDNKKVNFDIPWSGLCHLDKNRVTEYKSLWGDSKYNTIISNILDCTIYVPYNIFKVKLFTAFEKFKKAYPNSEFMILMDCSKFGSEVWLLHLLYNNGYFRNLNSKIIYPSGTRKMENDTLHILFIDDCVYTGSQLRNTLAEFFDKERIDFNAKIIVHIVSAFYNSNFDSKNYEEDFSRYMNLEFKAYGEKIYRCDTDFVFKLFNTDKSIIEEKGYARQFIDGLYEEILIDPNALPIYFDHKIAGEFSSFPSIYFDGVYVDKNNHIKFFGPLFSVSPNRDMNIFVKEIHTYLHKRKTPCDKTDIDLVK